MNMKKRILSYLFILGALMLLVGAAIYITGWSYAPHLFSTGAVVVAVVQGLSPVGPQDGSASIVLKRLRRQQLFGALMLVVSGVLMFTTHGNEWIVALTIAAVLQLYTAWRIPAEEARQQSR